ncbi:MAG: RbsD/FucU domain-containing protein, partial [Verrucomicrobiota bacterium]
ISSNDFNCSMRLNDSDGNVFTTSFTPMAKEFQKNNFQKTQQKFRVALRGVPTTFEPHVNFKKRVPDAIGLIRTGDTTQYANVILISG